MSKLTLIYRSARLSVRRCLIFVVAPDTEIGKRPRSGFLNRANRQLFDSGRFDPMTHQGMKRAPRDK
jgi:hypothetical protein